MKIPKSLFLIYCLILTNISVLAYASFVKYFQSGYEIENQIHHLESRLARTQFQKKIVENQLLDLQQTVAEVLPSKKKMVAEGWGTRALHISEQLRLPANLPPLDLTEIIFERGKKLFTQGKFTQAYREFESIREKYPSSDRVVECTFLMLESAYLQKDYKKTADIVDLMVSQYPENRLTGYALLRLAQVSELNAQFEEAAVLYRIVARTYSDEKLKQQAAILENRIHTQ